MICLWSVASEDESHTRSITPQSENTHLGKEMKTSSMCCIRARHQLLESDNAHFHLYFPIPPSKGPCTHSVHEKVGEPQNIRKRGTNTDPSARPRHTELLGPQVACLQLQ